MSKPTFISVRHDLNMEILMAAYRQIAEWAKADFRDPFWRLYVPFTPGAAVRFQGGNVSLQPDKLYLIPPNTLFSGNNSQPFKKMFVHFTLGVPYDDYEPRILCLDYTPTTYAIVQSLTAEATPMLESPAAGIRIMLLVMAVLSQLPDDSWHDSIVDPRIADTIAFLKSNSEKSLSIPQLAARVCLSPSAFTRLFRQETGSSPLQHLLQIRIDKAKILLQHSHQDMDRIARQCGFQNRHYFSRMFCKITSVPPARYRSISLNSAN
jgi:AraC-like DNA-binding protein